MSIEQDVAEIIESAVEIIDREGWIQEDLENDNGLCMIGGLGKAARLKYGVGKDTGWRFGKTLEEVHLHLPDPNLEIGDFNDAVGRTWGECRDVMISAAKTLREAG